MSFLSRSITSEPWPDGTGLGVTYFNSGCQEHENDHRCLADIDNKKIEDDEISNDNKNSVTKNNSTSTDSGISHSQNDFNKAGIGCNNSSKNILTNNDLHFSLREGSVQNSKIASISSRIEGFHDDCRSQFDSRHYYNNLTCNI